MEVKLGTIISRFAFILPSLYDDGCDDYGAVVSSSSDDEDTEDGRRGVCTSATYRDETERTAAVAPTGSRVNLTSSGTPVSPAERLGLTGAYAFVGYGSALSSASLTTSSSSLCGLDRGASLHLPDLVLLAARAWNVELHRGSTGAASHCVLRLPPCVVGTTLYRGPVVYVLASGVVRMTTHGSVAATEVLARRVRGVLQEACKPLAVRRAAREESQLLRAVLDDSLLSIVEDEDEDEVCERCPYSAVLRAEMELPSNGMPLTTTLAGDARTNDQHSRKSVCGASSTAARTRALAADKAGHDRSTLALTPSMPCTKSCTIDFVQAVATPRWDEIAGLRAALFTPASGSLGSEDGGGVDVAKGDRDAGAVPRVPVRRASVNVRGDAPMEWWRWYLDVQADDRGVGAGDLNRIAPSGGGTVSAAAANTGKPLFGGLGGAPLQAVSLQRSGLNDDAVNEGVPAESRPNEMTGFWTCAGYADASPAAASKFVHFLQRRRALLAHHVVSFKLRRQATQNSLQILLNWRTTTSPSSSLPLSATPPPLTVPLTGHPLLARGLVGRSTAATQPPPDLGPPPGPAAESTECRSGNAWVTEASAANFFIESTFIAESTAPYGLESVRRSTDQNSPAEPALPASRASGDGKAESEACRTVLTSGGGRESMSLLPEHDVGHSVVRYDGRSVTKAVPEKRGRGAAAFRTSGTKREAATVAVEHVTCVIHRTGRVQMTAASELALRQMCATLLIPFFVATAEVEL
ncbi:hypothetical protein, conserved [Leishmania lindenbergi]|uniref:CCZ1/INTU/HSP4 first Longin domain-containing protein n=1 Tax=Leishmania lindenbergi TaxID=651832 RepID=A0AAW3AU02_9TRYP